MAGATAALDEAQLAGELAAVLGAPPPAWTAELLTHNSFNAITAGIWRIRAGSRSFIRKVVAPGRADAAPQWAASIDPTHWNYWRREILAYAEGVTLVYADAGIAAPALLAQFPLPGGAVALWLVDLLRDPATTPGPRWSIDDFRRFAHRLGLAQGRIARDPAALDRPWLSRQFLRRYTTAKPHDPALLDSDAAWAQPLVRDHFSADLRPEWLRLHAERERFFALVEGVPQTLCHLDVWPNNLFARADGRFALVDWAFVGAGALGEDVGNLVPDAVFDLFVPASALPTLARATTEAYLLGLREGGWQGDARLVRLAICASAVKYVWLLPLMLARASDTAQLDYGGRATVDAARRYAERGAAFAFLLGWAREARSLAAELGVR
jgi:hypothetical protein